MPYHDRGVTGHTSNLDRIVSLRIPGAGRYPNPRALGLQALAVEGVLSLGWGIGSNYGPGSRTTIHIAEHPNYARRRVELVHDIHASNIPKAKQAAEGMLRALGMSAEFGAIVPIEGKHYSQIDVESGPNSDPREIQIGGARYTISACDLGATALVVCAEALRFTTAPEALSRATAPIEAHQWEHLAPVAFTQV